MRLLRTMGGSGFWLEPGTILMSVAHVNAKSPMDVPGLDCCLFRHVNIHGHGRPGPAPHWPRHASPQLMASGMDASREGSACLAGLASRTLTMLQ